MTTPKAELAGFALVQDITSHKRTKESLAKMSALLKTTFESISQGIIVTDPALNVIAFNHQYADFLDFPAGFLRPGMAFEDVLRFQAGISAPATWKKS